MNIAINIDYLTSHQIVRHYRIIDSENFSSSQFFKFNYNNGKFKALLAYLNKLYI